MNHKRGRSKAQRAGCLLCKPWKLGGAKDARPASMRERETEREERDYVDDLALVRYDLGLDGGWSVLPEEFLA
jgi:hypothetical protein